jgi:hypothetical protein
MNCHATIATSSRALLPIQQSAGNGNPVPWVRVHDLPDFVYFPHNVHVSNGVGCDCCHGRIDRMDRVYQVESLDMGWCLDCHRDPGPSLRPQEFITTMDWVAVEDPARLRSSLLARYNIPEHAPTDCSTCHR